MINLSAETKAPDRSGQVINDLHVVLSAKSVCSNDVYNTAEEKLGSIQDIMLDMSSGKIAYAVLSYGGFMNMGNHLFAVPWSALKLDTEDKRFILDVDIDRLKNAPGFDKDDWPDMADAAWSSGINSYYRAPPMSDEKPLPWNDKA